jgi:hypothetical protein
MNSRSKAPGIHLSNAKMVFKLVQLRSAHEKRAGLVQQVGLIRFQIIVKLIYLEINTLRLSIKLPAFIRAK